MSFNTIPIWCFGLAVGNALLLPVVTRQRAPIFQKLDGVTVETKDTPNMPSVCTQKQTIAKYTSLSITARKPLNPNAMAFVPCTYSPQTHCLLPIKEEHWRPQPLYSSHIILRCKYIVFIAPIITKNAIENRLFEEYFESDSDLFYHLRYQCKMQVIDGFYSLFRCNGKELAVFNTELHCAFTAAQVFVVAQPNVFDKQGAARWEMVRFMTALEIYKKYNINTQYLPSGSRIKLYQELRTQISEFTRDINIFKNSLNMDKMKRMTRIGQIRSERERKVKMIVTFAQLIDCIRASHEIRPIIWFDKKKDNRVYRIQMLLRVDLDDGCCIGITFDYNDRKQLYSVKFCIDDVDIRRKLALYKPSNHENDYKMFSNNISEMRFVDDADQQLIWQQRNEIKSLKSVVREKDEEIEKLKKERFDTCEY